jgi:hypothetical protein
MTISYPSSPQNFILFCKSFRDDVLRVKKLIESIITFNVEKIPFYLCVPQKDLVIFHQYIDFQDIHKRYSGIIELITDEAVVMSNQQNHLDIYYSMRGYISQQVIKAEVWRLLGCSAYLSLDSDSFFTQNFTHQNFLHPSGIPYTIFHDGKELLELSKQLKHPEVEQYFLKDSALVKAEFNRSGQDVDFGPAPLIWSSDVWKKLEAHLKINHETIWDAFLRIPLEIRWYGETLLHYQPIPLHPQSPIFTCYHFDWQAKYLNKNPLLINRSPQIIGTVVQSYWDDSLRPNFAKKPWYSRMWKYIKKIRKI